MRSRPTELQGTPIRSLEELGELIRIERKERGLTQSAAAELAGVGIRLWNETERGKREQLGLTTALRMLQTLGLDLAMTRRRPRERTP